MKYKIYMVNYGTMNFQEVTEANWYPGEMAEMSGDPNIQQFVDACHIDDGLFPITLKDGQICCSLSKKEFGWMTKSLGIDLGFWEDLIVKLLKEATKKGPVCLGPEYYSVDEDWDHAIIVPENYPPKKLF